MRSKTLSNLGILVTDESKAIEISRSKFEIAVSETTKVLWLSVAVFTSATENGYFIR